MIVKTLDYDKNMGYSIGMFVYVGNYLNKLTPVNEYGQYPFGQVVSLPDKDGYLTVSIIVRY